MRILMLRAHPGPVAYGRLGSSRLAGHGESARGGGGDGGESRGEIELSPQALRVRVRPVEGSHTACLATPCSHPPQAGSIQAAIVVAFGPMALGRPLLKGTHRQEEASCTCGAAAAWGTVGDAMCPSSPHAAYPWGPRARDARGRPIHGPGPAHGDRANPKKCGWPHLWRPGVVVVAAAEA